MVTFRLPGRGGEAGQTASQPLSRQGFSSFLVTSWMGTVLSVDDGIGLGSPRTVHDIDSFWVGIFHLHIREALLLVFFDRLSWPARRLPS